MAKKTREDVERLKEDWLKDACWDLASTDGFEDFKEELSAFEKEKVAEWDAELEKEKDVFLNSASYVEIMFSMYDDEKDHTMDRNTQTLIKASHLQTKALLMIAEQLKRQNDFLLCDPGDPPF